MINDEQHGKVWERIVLMCECPFLALSATIHNPILVRDWLAEAKRNRAADNPARKLFIKTFAHNDQDGLLNIFKEENLKTKDMNNNTSLLINEIESMLVNCSSKFQDLKKMRTVKDKLENICSILNDPKNSPLERHELCYKINLEFNDVILIEYKQPHTDFVYYTFAYNGPKTYKFENSVVHSDKPIPDFSR